MKVFLVDEERIHIYTLPKKIEDSYLINYVSQSSTEETISVIAKDGKWMIQSTPEVSFSKDDKVIDYDFLEANSVFKVKFSDLPSQFTIYVLDTPMPYIEYETSNKTEISIGSGNTCTIVYADPTFADIGVYFYLQNGGWILTRYDTNEHVYVNGYSVHQHFLQFGDVIFLHGIKIIWLESYIKVNVPKYALSTNLTKHTKTTFTDNKYTEVTDSEKSSVLYNDNQVFFHTPRLKETIIDQKISIQLPPQKNESERAPAFLQLGGSLMMGLSSSITGVIAIFNIVNGKATLMSSITEIVICISMLMGSIFFPMLLDQYQRRLDKKKEKKRQKKYKEYLDGKVSEMNQYMDKEKKILLENNLSISEIQNALVSRSNKIWSREITDSDFLSIRLGIGSIHPHLTIEAHLDDFSMEDDNLRQEVVSIINKELQIDEVPITVSLIEDKVLPIIVDNLHPYKQQFIDGLMLQLITYYSGVDLKIVVITDETNEHKWEYLKYLPHCCSNDQTEHYFASTEDEIKSLTTVLEKVRQDRVKSYEDNNVEDDVSAVKKDNKPETLYKDFDTYYLIVTDNYIAAKKYDFINKIIESDNNLGFSVLMFEDNMKNLPSQCNHFVNIVQGTSGVFSKDLSEKNQKIFTAEYQMDNNNDEYSRILANIPIFGESMSNSLLH